MIDGGREGDGPWSRSTSLAPLLAGARSAPREPLCRCPEQTKLPGLSGPGPEELSTTHLSRWRGARYHGLFLRVFKRDMHPFVFCVCVRVWVSWMP